MLDTQEFGDYLQSVGYAEERWRWWQRKCENVAV